MTFSNEISTSLNTGFNGSGGLSALDCLKFGLTVSANATITSKIERGFTINAFAWQKHMLRPYIYYYNCQYSGTYGYFCYNHFEKRYFWVLEDRTATNKYCIETGIRSWSRTNTAHNPNAVSPTPPTNWEW